jgi:uncharacterized protein YbaR (Trm112 family)
MFIELTDHLRCPADHDEQFLVLLPDRLAGRSVVEGQLGCPVCGRTYLVQSGILDFGGAPPAKSEGSALDAEALAALAGVNGPGGYVVLVGAPADGWRDLAGQMPGVALVAVNPGPAAADDPGVSVLRSGRIPLKSRSMRGVILGRGYADEESWVREAARVVLPGLRVVGEGRVPGPELMDLMADASGVWVGSPRR